MHALTRHYANDELSDADLEARLERVYAATTLLELHAVLADLPALTSPGAADHPDAAVQKPRDITAWFSGHDQKVTGVVPRELRVRARLGYVRLDLTRATFEPGVTVIDVRSILGYVQIGLPPGVRVESEGRALFGFFALKGAGASDVGPAASVVRFTGRAILGFAECLAF